ncbi:MAG: acylphosphatase [Plesiomonas sp.]
MSKISMKICIAGHVQGVGFRYFTQQQAQKLGVKGYARNLSDGRVEVLACGDELAINTLINWLSEGPRSANVECLMAEEVPFCELTEFDVR